MNIAPIMVTCQPRGCWPGQIIGSPGTRLTASFRMHISDGEPRGSVYRTHLMVPLPPLAPTFAFRSGSR